MHRSVSFYQCKHGKMAHFSDDTVLGVSLKRYGEWAEEEIDFLSRFISPGDIVIDVGANVGCHALAFSRLVGDTGLVIAIEGDPSTYSLLAHNIVANNLVGRIIPLHILAGSKQKTIQDKLEGIAISNAGARSFVTDVASAGESSGAPTRPLILTSIDSLNLPECSVIKIDVEGMEPQVVEGALGTIGKFRPVVYFEFASNDPQLLLETYTFLENLDYRMWYHYSNPYADNNFKADPHNIFGGTVELNIIACPTELKADFPFTPVTLPISLPGRPSLESQVGGVHISDYLPELEKA